MSRCLNRATLIGYLGADPEIRTLPGGARVAHVALATTRRWNDRDGKPREKTQWHRITVWDSLPSTFAFVETYVRKGDRIFVEGEIDYHSYEDREGVVRWSTEIRASEVLAAGELSGGEGKRAARKPAAALAGSGSVQMSAL
jgi:single-strand DNA-binding protein